MDGGAWWSSDAVMLVYYIPRCVLFGAESCLFCMITAPVYAM